MDGIIVLLKCPQHIIENFKTSKPVTTLELDYPMIQFFNKYYLQSNSCASMLLLHGILITVLDNKRSR